MSADERSEARDEAALELRGHQLAAHLLGQRDHGPAAVNELLDRLDSHREAAEVFAAALGVLVRVLPPETARSLAAEIRSHIPGLFLRAEAER